MDNYEILGHDSQCEKGVIAREVRQRTRATFEEMMRLEESGMVPLCFCAPRARCREGGSVYKKMTGDDRELMVMGMDLVLRLRKVGKVIKSADDDSNGEGRVIEVDFRNRRKAD